MRAEVSRSRWSEADSPRGRPIVSGRDGQISAELLRSGEFIRCIGALLTTVQAAPGGGLGGGSGSGVQCSRSETGIPTGVAWVAVAVDGSVTETKGSLV